MDLPDPPSDLYEYQQLAADHGFAKVIGIDEAGRGPLAGPVVVGAVVLPLECRLPKLNDSKQVSDQDREDLYEILTSDLSVECAVSIVDVDEIEHLNILQATLAGMRRCAAKIADADLIFVDGNPVLRMPCPSINIVQGDGKCAAIAAASIIAKVHRDRLMLDYAEQYPEYGFDRHKGYGTAAHLRALTEHGPCPIHRRRFAPVARIIQDASQGKLDLF